MIGYTNAQLADVLGFTDYEIGVLKGVLYTGFVKNIILTGPEGEAARKLFNLTESGEVSYRRAATMLDCTVDDIQDLFVNAGLLTEHVI